LEGKVLKNTQLQAKISDNFVGQGDMTRSGFRVVFFVPFCSLTIKGFTYTFAFAISGIRIAVVAKREGLMIRINRS